MSEIKSRGLRNVFPWLLLIGGILATISAIALSAEVYQRLKDPNFVPICNLNPILSCTSVADSAQAEAFGFPNYYLGIAGYAVIATVGAAMLAGAKFKDWFWKLFIAGMSFALLFLHWLMFETMYRIGALCLFCMVEWAVTIPLFWYTILYNYRIGVIKVPKRYKRAAEFLSSHHGDVLLVWFLVIIGLILKRFWYYWSTLI